MTTADNSTAPYLMEDPREKERLRDKVDAAGWVRKYLVPRLCGSEAILDVGCGPAALARAAAEQFPQAQVTGLERSDDRFAEATTNLAAVSNGRAVQGNACALPFETGQFDFIYTRFMLEYLADREQAIAEMVRVCKPGGRVMLQDLDGQLVWHWPIDEKLQPMIEQVLKYMATTGFDPFIGRKLFALAKSAGLTDIQVEVEPYHLYAGQINDENYRLWELKLDIALTVMEKALGSAERAEELKHRFMKYLSRVDTLTYSVVFAVTGRKLD